MKYSVLRIAVWFAIGIVLVFGLASASFLFRTPRALYEALDARRMQKQAVEALGRQAALEKADTYGGSTPEETFGMFMNALKAGDMELASKYFVIDKQEEWLSNLNRVKEAGLLKNMIEDLSKSEFDKKEGNMAWFATPGKNENGEIIYSQLSLIYNGNRWKLFNF